MEQTELVIAFCNIRKGQEEMARAVHKHLMTFHLAKDYNLELKSHDECEELLSRGKIPPKHSYWWPSEGGYALIIESRAKKFSTSWNKMITCYTDFCDGWRACLEQQ